MKLEDVLKEFSNRSIRDQLEYDGEQQIINDCVGKVQKAFHTVTELARDALELDSTWKELNDKVATVEGKQKELDVRIYIYV